MKIYLMTDLEGVAGVQNSEDWCSSEGRYYDTAKMLLTEEVNAAVDGFFEGGAREILVVDGHGSGGIAPELLDARVEFLRGYIGGENYTLGWSLDKSFDAIAWVGQHAKAGTEYAHLAHTGNMGVIDLSVNGISIGELGKLAMCASEIGVRSIFASGDEAMTKEAQELIPGIECISVKRGLSPGTGDELITEKYRKKNSPAIHLSPIKARQLIRAGALNAIKRARAENFGIITFKPPYERIFVKRPDKEGDPKMVSREIHETSIGELFCLPMRYL